MSLPGPHYETVGLESTRWLESYNIFPKKTQIAFNRCDFGKLRDFFRRTMVIIEFLIARLALMGWPEFDQGLPLHILCNPRSVDHICIQLDHEFAVIS